MFCLVTLSISFSLQLDQHNSKLHVAPMFHHYKCFVLSYLENLQAESFKLFKVRTVST